MLERVILSSDLQTRPTLPHLGPKKCTWSIIPSIWSLWTLLSMILKNICAGPRRFAYFSPSFLYLFAAISTPPHSVYTVQYSSVSASLIKTLVWSLFYCCCIYTQQYKGGQYEGSEQLLRSFTLLYMAQMRITTLITIVLCL